MFTRDQTEIAHEFSRRSKATVITYLDNERESGKGADAFETHQPFHLIFVALSCGKLLDPSVDSFNVIIYVVEMPQILFKGLPLQWPQRGEAFQPLPMLTGPIVSFSID